VRTDVRLYFSDDAIFVNEELIKFSTMFFIQILARRVLGNIKIMPEPSDISL